MNSSKKTSRLSRTRGSHATDWRIEIVDPHMRDFGWHTTACDRQMRDS
jgi:hypothetical protein